MKNYALAFCAVAALIAVPNAASAAPVACATLATDPGLTGYPGFKSATSVITPAAGPNVAYCNVQVVYGTAAAEVINVYIGLPLNSVDGGVGGTVQGAWNGRTQGNGGGGCSTGSQGSVTAGTNKGWVGSATDGGHGSANNGGAAGNTCEPAVNADGTYNYYFIQDFIRVGIKEAILESKLLSNIYYGTAPLFNYWSGCSTGGRQGYLLAQELGNELDGIMANAPAMYWTRFQTAQMWGQVAMKDMAGEPSNAIIPVARQNFATSLALASCDAADGVTDNIIDDTRTCLYSAANDPNAICIANGGTSANANCLTPAEATVMDKIWDGPRSSNGNKIWFHSDPGSGTTVWNGAALFALAPTQWHWDEKNVNFDWHTVTMFGAGGTKSYSNIAQDGSTSVFQHGGISLADITDTFGNFDTFRAHGGKLLTYVGGFDNLIMHRGVINHYRQMATRYGGYAATQNFYQFYRAPGVGHCGLSGADTTAFFNQLVAWVETGTPPSNVTATLPGGNQRPLCKYPQWAIYNGSGATNVAANFTCGGSRETVQTVCKDVLVKYKGENAGVLDYTGFNVPGSVVVNSAVCSAFAGQKFFNAVP